MIAHRGMEVLDHGLARWFEAHEIEFDAGEQETQSNLDWGMIECAKQGNNTRSEMTKLLACRKCQDVMKLHPNTWRLCGCRKTTGFFLSDNHHALLIGPAI